MSDGRRRPAGMDDLPFVQHDAVQWFSPAELVRTAWHVALSRVFGSYSDKREVQAALDVPTYYDHSAGSELWFDYVSDLGDGFDATYSVAYLLGRRKLDLLDAEGALTTPRGALLVMGGDEVYPTANATAYEDRAKGPYRAALPWSDDPPVLYALPGNHDWYDGLTSWLRMFCQGQWIGGRRTAQRRSYFAAKLPQGWWLLGLDIQLDSYIDGPQVEYFRRVAQEIAPDDGIVLCTGKPSWVEGGQGDPQSYATLDHFLGAVLAKDPRQVRLMLSGDAHHYARYAEIDGDRQLITCGGGGAYLSATHAHAEPLVLPPPVLHERELEPPECVTYDLRTTYPSAEVSRRLQRRVLDRLPRRNPTFVLLMAASQALLVHLYVSATPAASPEASLAQRWDALPAGWGALSAFRSTGLLALATLLTLAAMGFCRGGKAVHTWPGAVHAVVHVSLAVGLAHLLRLLPVSDWPDAAAYWTRLLLAALLGGAAATLVVGAYLLACASRGVHLNEVFSAQSIEDYKSFLRLHIGAEGDLTVHAVGVPRVCRRWHVPPSNDEEAPWVEPQEPLTAHLAEPPVRVPRRARS